MGCAFKIVMCAIISIIHLRYAPHATTESVFTKGKGKFRLEPLKLFGKDSHLPAKKDGVEHTFYKANKNR